MSADPTIHRSDEALLLAAIGFGDADLTRGWATANHTPGNFTAGWIDTNGNERRTQITHREPVEVTQ